MGSTRSLEELIKGTDALTYINALKVTLTEIKDELSQQDELRDYMNQSADRARKLMRKADNQYRIIAKLAQKGEAILGTDLISQEDEETFTQLEELMSDVG